VSAPTAHSLPRAEEGDGRGELLRRSFEDRLERREEVGPASVAVERLDRLAAAELEYRAALAAVADLPEGLRSVLAQVLALPPDVQGALAALLL
jgi:hypothetical protein